MKNIKNIIINDLRGLKFLNEVNISNKSLIIFFSFFFCIFSFYVVNQYSYSLQNKDFLYYLLGDGAYHLSIISDLDNELSFFKLHKSPLYNNNYYIFSLLILKLLKIFPGYDYSTVGLASVIVNLLSIYSICIFGYLICFTLSKSKIFSIGIIFLFWNPDLIFFGLRIYPDILQLSFIMISIYFIISNSKNYNILIAFIFCGLAFGVKAQGFLIFIYLLGFVSVNEYIKNKSILSKLFFFQILEYIFLFLITFFFLNHINPIMIFETILSSAKTLIVKKEINNFNIVFQYFVYSLRGISGLILFITFVALGAISVVLNNYRKAIFFSSLFFIFIFYLQLSFYSKLVQGPRYLYHLYPLILILISVSFFGISSYFNKKKIYFVNFFFAIIILVFGIYQFSNSFSFNRFDFKTQLKNDIMIEGYNFFSKIKYKTKNPYVCAGIYSLVPSNFSNRIKKTYKHIIFEEDIMQKKCDYIVLDQLTPGRYIWYEKNNNKLKPLIKEYSNLSDYNKIIGKEVILRTQKLIQYIVEDPKSGYNLLFINKSMIILGKK